MSNAPVENAKRQIRRLIELMERCNEPGWVGGLEKHLNGMEGWFATKEHLFQVGELCHTKCLGDNFIPGLSREEWWSEIERCKELCAIAFNELERTGPPKTMVEGER